MDPTSLESIDREIERLQTLRGDVIERAAQLVNDRAAFIQVCSAGSSRRYTYQVPDDYLSKARVGDYFQVHAPNGRDEIVQVFDLGRGSWTRRTKVAHPISNVVLAT